MNKNLLIRKFDFEKKIIFNSLTKNISIVKNEGLNDFIKNNNQDFKEIIREIDKVKSKKLALQISMTNSCNLKCSYCFNNGKKETKEIKTNFSIVKKLIKHIKEKQVKSIDIIFTGGEPLIKEKKLVYYIIFFNKIISKYKLNKSISLITNGILLSKDKIEKFYNLGLDNIQITIDGISKEGKFTRDNDSSLDKILKLLFEYNLINITLRLNINHENFENMKEIIFKLEKFKNKNMYVDIKRIYPTSSQKKIDYFRYHNLLPNKLINLYNQMKKLNIRYKGSYFDLFLENCSMESDSFFHVNENNQIDKCPYLSQNKLILLKQHCEKCSYSIFCKESCFFTKNNKFMSIKEKYCDYHFYNKIIKFIIKDIKEKRI